LVQVLFSVTLGEAVVAAPPSIARDSTSGNFTRSIVSLSVLDSPPALRALKYTVFGPSPTDNVNAGAVP